MYPPLQSQILYDLITRLAPFSHLPLVVMGDFNAILEVALDSSNPNRGGSAGLLSWVTGFRELWQWKHPMDRCYSHVSQAHGSAARIDLAFGNYLILPFVTDIDYLAGGLTDHNPLSLTLSFVSGLRGGGWRLSPSWLQHDRVAAQLEEAMNTYWSSNPETADPPIISDTFKAVTRGECISAIKNARVHDNEEIENLQWQEKECAEAYPKSPTGVLYESLLEARRSLSLHITGQARSEITRRAHSVFAEGDKNGKLLAMLVADYHPITNIPVIKNTGRSD